MPSTVLSVGKKNVGRGRSVITRPNCNRWQRYLSFRIIIFLLNYLTVLVIILKQLFTSVSVASGGYLPLCFAAR